MATTFAEHVAAAFSAYEALEHEYVRLGVENAHLRRLVAQAEGASPPGRHHLQNIPRAETFRGASRLPMVPEARKYEAVGNLLREISNTRKGKLPVRETPFLEKASTASTLIVLEQGATTSFESPAPTTSPRQNEEAAECDEECPSQASGDGVSNSEHGILPSEAFGRRMTNDTLYTEETKPLDEECEDDGSHSSPRYAPWLRHWIKLVRQMLWLDKLNYWVHTAWTAGTDSESNLGMLRAVKVMRKRENDEIPDDIFAIYQEEVISSGWYRKRRGSMFDNFVLRVRRLGSDTSESSEQKANHAQIKILVQSGSTESARVLSACSSDAIDPEVVMNTRHVDTGMIAWHESHSPASWYHVLLHPLHPSGKIRVAWNLVAIAWIAYDAVVLSLEVFHPPETLVWQTLEWMSRIFWTLDIMLSFRTGFYVNAKYEFELCAIAKRYFRTWLIIDCIAVVPDWIMLFIDKRNKRLSSTFKAVRLIRLIKMRLFLKGIVESLNSVHLVFFIDLVIYSLMMILWVHICGCLWYAIGKGASRSWITENGFQDVGLPHNYFISVQWAVSQLQGNIDFKTASVAGESGFHVSMALLSIVVLAIFISKLTNMTIQLETVSRHKAKHLRALQDYLSIHRISTDVSINVKKYAEQKLTLESKQLLQEQDVLAILPKALRKSLLQEVRGPRIEMNNPFFRAARFAVPKLFQRICCDLLVGHFSEPDSLVYVYGEECARVLFLMGGDVVYDHYSNEMISRFLGNHRRAKNDTLLERRMTGLPAPAPRLTPTRLNSDVPMDDRRSPRMGSTISDSHTAIAKTVFRERLLAKGAILDTLDVDRNRSLCEASLWTKWEHKGDVSSKSHASFLALDVEKMLAVVECDIDVKRFGALHAFRFCRVLNHPHVELTDFISSESVLHLFDTKGNFRGPERHSHFSSSRHSC